MNQSTNGRKTVGTPKNGRKLGHRFEPGNKYGKGRPEGSRNKATIALQSLLDAEAEKITRKAIEMALAGDVTALRLVLERLIPPARERRLNLALPSVDSAADLPAAASEVLRAIAAGEITPAEGQAVAGVLNAHRQAVQTAKIAEAGARSEGWTLMTIYQLLQLTEGQQ